MKVERDQPDTTSLTRSTNPIPVNNITGNEEMMKKLFDEVEELKLRRNCKVCWDKEVRFFCFFLLNYYFYLLSDKVAVVFIPCAHLAACISCAIDLKVS